MRLGGEVKRGYANPEEWMALVKEMRYSTVHAPVDYRSSSEDRKAYVDCAKANDIMIGEVGVWRNTLSLDEEERKQAVAYAKEQLALAEELGARCCVNIVGNRGPIWDGFSEANYHPDTYSMIVDMVRDIIDGVKPKHTFYTLEPMPWMVPDSPEQYLQLLKDVNRASFGVHLDFVNMINCPKHYVQNQQFIASCFELLGPYIKSIHGKDVLMEQKYTTIIHELMPGKGILDYKYILPLVEKLGPDTPFFIEHLPDWDAYVEAATYIRDCAESVGVKVLG